jgi:hypothetical protein
MSIFFAFSLSLFRELLSVISELLFDSNDEDILDFPHALHE